MKLQSRFRLIEDLTDQITFEESPSYIDAAILGLSGTLMCGIARYGMSMSDDKSRIIMLMLSVLLLSWAACGFIRSKFILNGETQTLCVQRRLAGVQLHRDYPVREIRRAYQITNPKSGRAGVGLELASGKKKSLTIWKNSPCLQNEVAIVNASIMNFRKRSAPPRPIGAASGVQPLVASIVCILYAGPARSSYRQG
jgi:hypothetical protein